MANATTDSTVILCFSAGKASADLVGDHALIASIAGDKLLGVNATNLISDDGANSQTLAHGGFLSTQIVVALLQTDISESQKRLGVWINGSITWAAWAAFDLSFDVESYLDFLVNSETMTFQAAAIYSSILSDADIIIDVVALGFPVAPSTPSPADGATVAYTTSQALQVTNADSGTCDIKFYTSAGVQIGATQSSVAAGATATVTWTGLKAGLQSWYATATNTVGTAQSATFSFTINAKPTVDNLSPANGSSVTARTTVALSARYNDASVGSLRFYNKTGDALIGTASGLNNGDTGTVNWTGRTPGQSYTYYVIPNDGTDDGTASADTTFSILSGVGVGTTIVGHNPTMTGHMGNRGFHGFNV